MTATQTSPSAPPAAGTRRSSRTGAVPAAWPRVIAAIHAQETSLKVVIARQDAPDATPTVVDASTLQATDTSSLSALLARHKAVAAVHLIPSANTVARCLPLPTGLSTDRNQAAASLSLVAESEMPSTIPAHRRAAGIVRPGPDASPDAVLAVGWPERGPVNVPTLPVKDQSWTPELVALAALARAVGGVDLAIYADRHAGSIAMLATGRPHHANGVMNGAAPQPARTVARVLRGDTSSDAAWRASFQRAVVETAGSVGISAPGIQLGSDAPFSLLLHNAAQARPAGVPAEAGWLTNYGLAYGGLCSLASADPAVRNLSQLRADAPREDVNLVVRTVEYFSVRRRAIIAAVACLAVLLLWPLGVAKSRELILANRAGAELDTRLKEAERRVAFYKQLREKRWPMTKLIADISGAAPVGVHVDAIVLGREQGVSIRARAQEQSQIIDFRANLNASSVFSSVNTPNIEIEGDAITFQLDAQVVAPHYPGRRAGDFVKDPLAVRLHGERARKSGTSSSGAATASSGTPAPTRPSTETTASSTSSSTIPDSGRASTPAPSSDSGRASSRPTRGSLRGDNDQPAEPSTGTRRAASTSKEIPPPISDAEIAKLDRQTAMSEFSNRKAAASRVEDPAVKQRLLEESEKCRARMQEAGRAG